MAEPSLVFMAAPDEIRVNFGIFAGREATPAEIDELAQELKPRVSGFSVEAEQHYEFGEATEAVVHLIRIHIPEADDELRGRLLEIVERWAQARVAERHVEVAEL
jgi:hypothetical protein